MSRSVDIEWQIRREQQHRIYLQNVAATTSSFLERYQSILDDIADQNLVQYIEEDYNQASALLQEALRDVDTDPEAARELSRRLGGMVGGLPRLARSIREKVRIQNQIREQERARAERKEYGQQRRAELERTAEFKNIMEEAIKKSLSDPVTMDFAYDDVKTLKQKYVGLAQTSSDPAQLKQQFERELSPLVQAARAQAVQWKNRQKQEQKKTAVEEQIRVCSAVVEQHVTAADTSKLRDIMSKLQDMQNTLVSGADAPEKIENGLQQVASEVEEVLYTEELRRQTLRALKKTLKELGFLFPEPPTIEGDFVRLTAKRPNGEECTFLVKQDGGMRYSFDKYRGSACKKDLAVLLPKLDEVYGIALSNERVIWENPDEIGKEAEDLPSGNQYGGNR